MDATRRARSRRSKALLAEANRQSLAQLSIARRDANTDLGEATSQAKQYERSQEVAQLSAKVVVAGCAVMPPGRFIEWMKASGFFDENLKNHRERFRSKTAVGVSFICLRILATGLAGELLARLVVENKQGKERGS